MVLGENPVTEALEPPAFERVEAAVEPERRHHLIWWWRAERVRPYARGHAEAQSALGYRLLGALMAEDPGRLQLDIACRVGGRTPPSLTFGLNAQGVECGDLSPHLDLGRWFESSPESPGELPTIDGSWQTISIVPSSVTDGRKIGFLPDEPASALATDEQILDWSELLSGLSCLESLCGVEIRIQLDRAKPKARVRTEIACQVHAGAGKSARLLLSSLLAPNFEVSTSGTKTQWVTDLAAAARLVPYPISPGGGPQAFPVATWQPLEPSPTLGRSETPLAVELGHAGHRNLKRVIGLPESDFNRHVHVMGQTGTGKSTLIANMAHSEARNGRGFCVLDPHGTLVDSIADALPKSARARLIVLDAASADPPKINVLNARGLEHQSVVVQDLGEMFYDLFDPLRSGIVGPRFEAWLRIGFLSLIDAHGSRASLLDVPRLFTDTAFLRELFPKFKNPLVIEFWSKEMAQTSDYHKSEMLGWFASKFERFRSSPTLSAMLASGEDSVDFASAMDRRKIILIRLSTADVGDVNARLLGYLYLSRIWTGALCRKKRTQPFTVYVDEYQSFTASVLPRALAEGRKFGLRIVASHQFMEQLRPEARHALRATAGNRILFRGADAPSASKDHFADWLTLDRMPNFHALAYVLQDNAPADPFTFQITPAGRVNSRKL